MISFISTELLKVHPKNQEYYSDLPEEKYQEIKKSIEVHGIRDPLKILPDYTIVAGHQRLRIAKELKLEKVPVIVLDISPEEAEYLLIADNEERRQDDKDLMRKAKRAKFLAEYWNIKKGGKGQNQYTGKNSEMLKDQNGLLANTEITKTLQDIAEAVNESETNLKRLLKLNDLIPSLQSLVSSGNLSQTAAYSLAFLTPDEQESLLRTLGESGICDLSTSEARELRKELEEERKNTEKLQSRLIELEKEKESLSAQISDMENNMENIEEDIAEKLQSQYEEKFQQATSALKLNIENLKEKLRKSQENKESVKKQQAIIKQLEAKNAELEKQLKAVNKDQTAALQAKVEALKIEKDKLVSCQISY